MIIKRFEGKYEFLSNFFEHPILWKGLLLPTSEHPYQMEKTLDVGWRAKVAETSTPNAAKKVGRSRNLPLRPDWDEIKIPVMREVLGVKFAPASDLADLLLDTGQAMLIEGNWWGDKFWGVCDGEGQNWLGWLLMAQRSYLWSVV